MEQLDSTAGRQGGPPSPHVELEHHSLSARLATVERERNDLAAELARLKQDQLDPSRGQSSTHSREDTLTIPSELVPVLSLLRSHIADLTRDNEALRYTFLGKPTSTSPTLSSDSYASLRHQGVDLEQVLKRVKDLARENEELGEMIMEAGKARTEDWQKAVEDSRAVITSLDFDLEHHLALVGSLRDQLSAYEKHFGPLPTQKQPKPSSEIPQHRSRSRASNDDRDKLPKEARDRLGAGGDLGRRQSGRGRGGQSGGSRGGRRQSQANGQPVAREAGSGRSNDTPSVGRGGRR